VTEHKENGKFKIFIEDKPNLIKDIKVETKQLLRDHKLIFHGLMQNPNLSAKDIHELYWDPAEHKYTKSMKTVYRYLDLLEEAGLVKVSGHRKPVDSHMTEKLYCRTALLYYSKEPVKWWELPEYKNQFDKETEFYQKLKK
jgi:Fe2+ or Zn2+ uptake regulation protein